MPIDVKAIWHTRATTKTFTNTTTKQTDAHVAMMFAGV